MENTILSIPVSKMEFSSVDDNKAKAKLYIMHEDLNYNESVIPFSAMQDAESTISNIPIVAYVRKENEQGNQDFGGHEIKQELATVDGQLILKTTFLEQPIGVIPETNGYHYEEIDGQRWVVANGYIWKNYSNEAYDILEQAGAKGISMEIKVVDGELDSRTGFYVIKKFVYLGITVLGDDITPAMGEKARIQMYSTENKKQYFSMCKKLNEELKQEVEKEVKALEFAKNKKIENTGDGYANGLDVKEEIKQIKEAEMMSDASEEKALDKLESKSAKSIKKDMEGAEPVHIDDEEDGIEKNSCHKHKSEEDDKEKESCHKHKSEEDDKEKESCEDIEDECEDNEMESCHKHKSEEDDKEKHSIKEKKVKTDNEDAENRKENKKTAKEVEEVEDECEDKEDMAKCKDKEEKEHYARKKKEVESDNSQDLSINYIVDQITAQLDKIKENVEAWWTEDGTAEMPKYMMVDLLVEKKTVIVTNFDNDYFGIPYVVKGDEVILEMDEIKPYISAWKEKETFGGSELRFEAKKKKAIKKLVDDSKKAYDELNDKYEEVKEECEKLKEFKLEIDKQTRFVEIDNLIGEFKFSEDEVAELRKFAYEEKISMDELKKELYALEGMRVHRAKEVYSSAKKNPVLGYSINTNKVAQTSKYGEASIYFR